jgi:hypothetical protein
MELSKCTDTKTSLIVVASTFFMGT